MLGYQFGLVGYPIGHSLSPWIHQQFLEQYKMDGTYELFEITPKDNFSQKLSNLKESGVNGFNVTVPYKETVLNFLDKIDESAEQIGAVNTIHCENGKWVGYNTDGIGFVRSLEYEYPELTQRKSSQILIIGAGGAAKGIYHGLMRHGYTNITIANRTLKKAVLITENDQSVLNLEEAADQLSSFDVIIQTTSVGMKPNIDQTVLSLQGLNSYTIVCDIVYQPLLTKFLQEAKLQGASIHFGHTMLLFQAQAAFEIWTKKNPDMTELASRLQLLLEG